MKNKKTIKYYFNMIRILISNLVFKYVKEPLQKRKENKLREAKLKISIADFESKTGVDYYHVLRLMELAPNNIQHDSEFLNEELRKNRLSIIKLSKYINKIPKFVDPDVINMHNEYLSSKNPTIAEIISDGIKETDRTFRAQEESIRRMEMNKASQLTPINDYPKILNSIYRMKSLIAKSVGLIEQDLGVREVFESKTPRKNLTTPYTMEELMSSNLPQIVKDTIKKEGLKKE